MRKNLCRQRPRSITVGAALVAAFVVTRGAGTASAQGTIAVARLSQPDVANFNPLDYQIGQRGVLDGSPSTGPGLRFEWRIEQAAWGPRQGEVICRTQVCDLRPLFFTGRDVGNWTIRLRVTDVNNFVALDWVELRVDGYDFNESRSPEGREPAESGAGIVPINRHGDPPCGNVRVHEDPKDKSCRTPVIVEPIPCASYDDYNFHGLLRQVGPLPGLRYWTTNSCDSPLPNGAYEPYYQHREPQFEAIFTEIRRLAALESIPVTINDGWDQDGGHNEASKHYEGRAVDVDWSEAKNHGDVGLGRLAYLVEKALRNVLPPGARWWIWNETSRDPKTNGSHVHFSLNGATGFDWGVRCGDKAGRACLNSVRQASPASSGAAVGEMLTGWGRSEGWPQNLIFQEAGSPPAGISCDPLARLVTKYDLAVAASWQCLPSTSLDDALRTVAYSAAWWRDKYGTGLTAAIPWGSYQRWVAVEGVVTRPPDGGYTTEADPLQSGATPTEPWAGVYRVEGLFIDDPQDGQRRFVSRDELQRLFQPINNAWQVLLPAFQLRSLSATAKLTRTIQSVFGTSQVRIAYPLDYLTTESWFEVGLPVPIEVLAPEGTTWARAEIVGGSVITEKTRTPWTLVWVPRETGLVTLRVLANTKAGLQEARVEVEVRDTLKPSVAFDPELATSLHGETTVRVFADDNDSVTFVNLLIGGPQNLNVEMTPCADEPHCWQYQWNPTVTGRYGLTATAHDPRANVNQAVLDVTVEDVGSGGIAGSVELFGSATRPAGETVYIDANGSGDFETGELSATTALDGTYWLKPVPMGTHQVRIYTERYEVSFPTNGQHTVTVGFDQLVQGINFQLTGVGRIAGVLRDQLGNPLSGARIYIDTSSNGAFDPGEPSTLTDTGGAYEFTRLIAGTYPVRVVTTGGQVVLSPTSEVQRVSLATSRDNRTGIDFVVGPPRGQIDGVVRHESGLPVSGVLAYIDTDGSGEWEPGEPLASIGASGEFAFTALAKGTYRIGVTGSLGVLEPPGRFHVVTLENHSDRRTVSFVVGLGRIEGFVRTESGRGIGSVLVYVDLSAPFGSYQTGEPASTSQADGSYSISSIPFGTRTVRVVVAGDITGVVSPPGGARAVDLFPAQAIQRGIDFTVSCSCLQIQGRVAADAGQGIVGAVVYLDFNRNHQLDLTDRALRTDGSGSYTFNKLAAGTYDVAIVLPPAFDRFVDPASGYRTVILQPKEDATGVNFSISGPPATPPGATRISQNLIRQTFTWQTTNGIELPTQIPVRDWVCAVTGFAVDREVFYVDSYAQRQPVLAKRAVPSNDGYWRVKANLFRDDFASGGPGSRTVDLVCLSRDVASTGPSAKPFFRSSAQFRSTDPGFGLVSLGIDANRYACEMAGLEVNPAITGNLWFNTNGDHDVRFYLEQNGSVWHLRKYADLRSLTGHTSIHIDVDVLCTERSMAQEMTFSGSHSGFTVPPIGNEFRFFTGLVNNAGDNADIKFEGLDDWECGLGGYWYFTGDLNENGGRSRLVVHWARYDGDKWHLRADVRSHGIDEFWQLPFYCIRRNDPPGPTPLITVARPERLPQGHGIHLEWTPTALPGATYYELQYATRLNPPNWALTNLGNGLPVSSGATADHYGALPCKAGPRCLPNGREQFYRVRVLDNQRQPISDWSRVVGTRVTDYLGFSYLVGDWDGDGRDNLAVRRANRIFMDTNFDGAPDREQQFGNGDAENEYLVGDWDGDGRDNLAVRRGNCVYMDYNFDGAHDRVQCYGNGSTEDQYLAGDWDGDGRDNLAVRRWNEILMDYDFNETPDRVQTFGAGGLEDDYLVGDWNNDGRDNVAVVRGSFVFKDYNFDSVVDDRQHYGMGIDEAEYLAGNWDGSGSDNVAVRRAQCVLMDFNNDGFHDREQCFGSLSNPTLSIYDQFGQPVVRDIFVRPGERTTFRVQATDADNDYLELVTIQPLGFASLTGTPGFGAVEGELLFFPEASELGQYTLEIGVRDAFGGLTTTTLLVNVCDQPGFCF